MTRLTVEQYFAAYRNHPEITMELRVNAELLLMAVNAALDMAAADGVELETNQHADSPHFGTLISGGGNGGWRPSDCPTGAPASKHKRALAVDLCDHANRLDPWSGGSDRQDGRLIVLNIAREHPDATLNWCHWQLGAPKSGHFLFHP